MQANNDSAREILTADLIRLPWTQGLDQSIVEEIADAVEYLNAEEGEEIQRAGDSISSAYFVTRGRIKASVIDLFGRTVLERHLVRGGCFGLFSVTEEEHAAISIVASEPTSLLRMSHEKLYDLSAKHRSFQMNMYRLAANQVRKIISLDRRKDQPSVVGIVHQHGATRLFTRKLIERLLEIEETPCLASDDSSLESIEGVPFRSLIEQDGSLIKPEDGMQQIKAWSKMGRIVMDIKAEHRLETILRFLRFVDTVFWCVRPEEAEEAVDLLKELQNRVAGWREKICLVWFLNPGDYTAPLIPNIESIVDRTFKISSHAPAPNQGTLLNHGFERLIHHLRGIRIGIALGGGAARGMAHLGVLKALEQNGIYIDMIAGTSAGAMTGTLYAYGMDVDYNIRCFEDDLRLPKAFRHLPGGGYWYLLYKYRRGQFDPMLRKYLGDAKLNQLSIPTYTVTVDLVRGGPVVRENEDAVRSILESINLPGLSSPLLSEHEALVDGGLVNNIPADVLVEKGCNFVIASSVTASLEKMFSGIHSERGQLKRRKPSTLQVLMRGYLVQSHNMNAVGVQPADFMIAPDVTGFDLSEFERTEEMARIGEQTTRDAVQQIKNMLSKLDDKLFPINA